MSAFICNHDHILAIVQSIPHSEPIRIYVGDECTQYRAGDADDMQTIGQTLVDENFRSVNARYNESETPYTFQYKHFSKRFAPIQIIKAIHCYIYQSCEHPGWNDSAARDIVMQIEKSMIRRLPGYEDADWEIKENTPLDPVKAKQETEKMEAERMERQHQENLKKYDFLEREEDSKKTGHALAAANMRRELRRAFPGQKFSVRSDSYSGGSSVDVSWIDGPKPAEVRSIVGKYENGCFDGMTDTFHHTVSAFRGFGDVRHVFCNRKISVETAKAAAEHLKVDITIPSDSDYWRCDDREDQERISRHLADKSYYVAPEETKTKREPSPKTKNGKGLHLKFEKKPAQQVLSELKSNGWKWHRKGKYWYHKDTEYNRLMAKAIERLTA